MISAPQCMSATPAWQPIPFGSQSAHVEVDFSAPRPYVVTAVLAACLRDEQENHMGQEQVWQWSVARRLQGLLVVVAATASVETLEFSAECEHCAELLSFDLPLEGFVQPVPKEPLSCQLKDGGHFKVRLPTGNDQRHWLQCGSVELNSLARDLVVGSVEEQAWSAEHLAAMEVVLESADPYTALDLDVVCPVCEEHLHCPFDLEASLLQYLRRSFTDTLRDVHRLARAYHWSEMEILSLPAQRRDFYLTCLTREGRL